MITRQKPHMKGKNKMKKIALILAVIIAVLSVSFVSCEKKQEVPEGNISITVPEGNISITDALAKVSETETKTDLDNEILITIEGVPVSAAAVKYANVACRQYRGVTDNADEETLASINQEIDEFYRLNAAILKLSEKHNLSVTEEYFNENVVSYIDYVKQAYGEQFDTMLRDYYKQTPVFFAENMVYTLGYETLYNYLLGPDGVSEKKQEVYDSTIAQMKENDYVHAKHILISFPEDIEKDENGVVVESAKAETLARANEVLDKVNAGEDFDELIKTYGEDPGMETYPDGYFFTKGEMVEAFEKTTYALNEGEVSGLVETPYGYHIIKKLPVEDPAVVNSEIYKNAAYDTLRALLVDVSKDYKLDYAENYQQRVDEFVAEYAAEVEAEMQAQAQMQAEAEAQAQTEAEGK